MSNIPFFMLYMEGSGAPTYKHTTYDSAIQEAKRLCSIHKAKVYVLPAAHSIEPSPQFIEKRYIEDDNLPF